MTSIEPEKIEALASKAKMIRDVMLREREEARALQLFANAEIRRGWRESDNWNEAKSVSTLMVSGEGDELKLRRLAAWLQYVSAGITQRIRAVSVRLQIDRSESTPYVMNLIHGWRPGIKRIHTHDSRAPSS